MLWANFYFLVLLAILFFKLLFVCWDQITAHFYRTNIDIFHPVTQKFQLIEVPEIVSFFLLSDSDFKFPFLTLHPDENKRFSLLIISHVLLLYYLYVLHSWGSITGNRNECESSYIFWQGLWQVFVHLSTMCANSITSMSYQWVDKAHSTNKMSYDGLWIEFYLFSVDEFPWLFQYWYVTYIFAHYIWK